jgi:hypothetical protein
MVPEEICDVTTGKAEAEAKLGNDDEDDEVDGEDDETDNERCDSG